MRQIILFLTGFIPGVLLGLGVGWMWTMEKSRPALDRADQLLADAALKRAMTPKAKP